MILQLIQDEEEPETPCPKCGREIEHSHKIYDWPNHNFRTHIWICKHCNDFWEKNEPINQSNGWGFF